MNRNFYCDADNKYYHFSEVPRTLKPFVNYQFSSGGFAGDDFKTFDTKFKNRVKKILPEGYRIYAWHRNHYESSAVIEEPEGRFIYLSYPDVRFWINEWLTNILIRTMKNDHDWTGGYNHRTSLLSLGKNITQLYN